MGRWFWRATGEHVRWLRRRGVGRARLLADAFAALGAAVVAWRRCFARHAAAWTLIGAFTGGLLGSGPTGW